ncbi:MAG TPA: hypothetical protein VKA98_10280, partial [Nitrososphaeraceae archaeon]|nr:hypothetical protein [Nitrososphaeraceae archaeon]
KYRLSIILEINLQISEERRKQVIDLYFNQHKTYAEITQIEKISPRDIHAILNEEEARRQNYKDQQQQEEKSSKAYKLFSEGKTPVQVAVTSNLGQPEVTKLYREYWKLKRLHKLNLIYEEIGDDIRHIIELHRRTKKEGAGIEQILKLLQLADEDNSSGILQLERRRKWRIDEIHERDMQIERSKGHLHSVNDEIASAKALLNSYHTLCERKRQEAANLNKEIFRLETIISRFKNNDEEYLKIEKTVEQKVKSVLIDNKQILQFSLASVIEAIRRNPDKYNNLLVSNTAASSTSTPAQGSLLSNIEGYRDMILEEANGLYDSLLHHLTNSIMDNAAGASS